MKISQAFKMAFFALRGNKMRSFLTMLGIIIGVVAVTLLISVVQGATGEITGQIESLGSNLLHVSFTGMQPTHLTISDLEVLEQNDAIFGVTGVVTRTANIRAGHADDDYSVEGVTRKYQDITEQVVKRGRFISDIDVEAHTYNAVVGIDVATELFGTENCIGNTLDIGGFDFTVVGLLEESDTMLANKDSTVLIPLTTAQRLFKNTEFDAIYISATAPDTVDAAEEATDDFLIRELGDDDSYFIINQSAIIDVTNEVIDRKSIE